MLDVVKAQLPPLAVLQPFLRGLVAADIEPPGHLGRIGETLGGVDPDATVLEPGLVDDPVPLPLEREWGGADGGGLGKKRKEGKEEERKL